MADPPHLANPTSTGLSYSSPYDAPQQPALLDPRLALDPSMTALMGTTNGVQVPTAANASYSANPPSTAFAVPLNDPSHPADEDTSDWEYEYSTTETETYYLTLDLSHPRIPFERPKTNAAPRRFTRGGGLKSVWINPGMGRHKRQLGSAPVFTLKTPGPESSPAKRQRTDEAADDDKEEDEDLDGDMDANMADEDDDGDTNMQDSGNATTPHIARDTATSHAEAHTKAAASADPFTEGKEDEDEGDNGDQDEADDQEDEDPSKSSVQILDLHSDNPFISYRGHTYSCSWAENLGTELLFAWRDPDPDPDNNDPESKKPPLPYLRALADGVDLLGASCARIISTPVDVKQKQGIDLRAARIDDDHSRPTSNGDSITANTPNAKAVPDPAFDLAVGPAAAPERKSQASFLSRLIALKKSKHETDEVTVNSMRRLYPSQWKALAAEKRAVQRRKLQEQLETLVTDGNEEGNNDGKERKAEIEAKLKEMDVQETALAVMEKEKLDLIRSVNRRRLGRKPKADATEAPVDFPAIPALPAETAPATADAACTNAPSQEGGRRTAIQRRPRISKGRRREGADLSFLIPPNGNGQERLRTPVTMPLTSGTALRGSLSTPTPRTWGGQGVGGKVGAGAGVGGGNGNGAAVREGDVAKEGAGDGDGRQAGGERRGE